MTRTELFGIPFDDLAMNEAVDCALRLIGRKESAYTVTPNPEIVLLARENPQLLEALRGAALALPDGVGLILASGIIGTPLRHRLPGIDFASALMAVLARRQGSVYLLGAKPGVAERAAEQLQRRYPGLRIAGTRHGYFSTEDEAAITAEIQKAAPSLLLVCLGAPKQELWMHRHSADFPGTLMLGLGGALDVYAGDIPRAPESWRRLGLEWLYRLLLEPRRIKRMIRLPGILRAALTERNRSRP